MFIDSDMKELYDSDPHKGDEGYYLVAGVNLVAECDNHDPCGLLDVAADRTTIRHMGRRSLVHRCIRPGADLEGDRSIAC